MDTSFTDPQSFANVMVTALQNRQWALVLALFVLAAVWGIRKIAPKIHGKTGALLNSGPGGIALSFAVAETGAMVTGLVSGKPLSLDLALSGFVTAATASGLFSFGSGIKQAKAAKKAAAASAVTAPTSAIPPAASLLPLAFLALFASACTSAQTAMWKTFGIDALKCAGASVGDAAASALVDLMGRLNGAESPSSVDPKAMGAALAVKYGKEAALCALGKAAADLMPAVGMHAAPTARTRLIQGMLDSQKEWAK